MGKAIKDAMRHLSQIGVIGLSLTRDTMLDIVLEGCSSPPSTHRAIRTESHAFAVVRTRKTLEPRIYVSIQI